MNIEVVHLSPGANLQDAFGIRSRVFQQEDGIKKERDFDGLDETAEQFVAYDGLSPVGTARFRFLDAAQVKIERVAVLEEYRGRSVGSKIMRAVLAAAKEHNASEAVLNSKVETAAFYEVLGFESVGEVFMEEDIPHIKMKKAINDEGKRGGKTRTAMQNRIEPYTADEQAKLFADPQILLTPYQTARLLQVDARVLHSYAKKGWLHPIKTLGGHRRYKVDEIKSALESMQHPEKP